jgi:hypothetical protein
VPAGVGRKLSDVGDRGTPGYRWERKGGIRSKRVDMLWIWEVYWRGDKFRVIVVINAVALTQNTDSVRKRIR